MDGSGGAEAIEGRRPVAGAIQTQAVRYLITAKKLKLAKNAVEGALHRRSRTLLISGRRVRGPEGPAKR